MMIKSCWFVLITFWIVEYYNHDYNNIICHALSMISSSKNNNQQVQKKKKKIQLPFTEQINRRKSPALWRDDLSLSMPPIINTEQIISVQSNNGKEVIKRRKKPEIMSPAGGWEQLKAAISNGADSIYVGLSAFSARARATNFDVINDLPKAVQLCHKYNVQLYVALNTLVFDHELDEVSELIQLSNNAGIDALIVQDLGICKLIQNIAPNIPIHSSTQQTITSSDGVLFCKQHHNATRVVLGRELSIYEMKQVCNEINNEEVNNNNSNHNSNVDVEIEAFVHGALCVSYSGQCFSSEAWGGRSANRGQCAQACRLPYGLVANGQLIDLQDMAYLLSPQDLCGLDQIPDLIDSGVACFKIEGRLKDATYVAAATRAYRNAVDQAWYEKTGETSSNYNSNKILADENESITKLELSQLFSRGQDETYTGLTPGFLDGTQHQMLVRGRSPRHRGVHVGRVVDGSSFKNGLIIEYNNNNNNNINLKRGDGIVIDRGMAQEEELGGPIFDVIELGNNKLQILFGRDVMNKWKKNDTNSRKGIGKPLVPINAHVWKTNDVSVKKKMQKLSESSPPRLAVQVAVSGSIGTPLYVTITDGKYIAIGETDDVLQQAQTSGLDALKVEKAIGTLGDTRWTIHGNIDLNELDTDAWCPISWIKEARRRAVCQWEALHHESTEQKITETKLILDAPQRLLEKARLENTKSLPKLLKPKLVVLARNIDQVEAACELVENGDDEIDEIIIDFLEVEGMKEAVARIRQTPATVVVASPRIIKPGESGIWRTLLRLEPDALLVRSTGLLYRLQTLGGTGSDVDVGTASNKSVVKIPKLYGDFSLNAANALTALELLNAGLDRITASYDINANAITEMAKCMSERSSQLEVTVHAKLPIFHTEHCVFARFLSNGNSYLDCGHVCTRNNVHLRDQSGADNLVLADMGCRNTVFSSEAQSGCHSVKDWKNLLGALRIELVDESKEDSKIIIREYLGLIQGHRKPSEVWEVLSHVKDSNGRESGISLGSFNNKIQRRAGEVI